MAVDTIQIKRLHCNLNVFCHINFIWWKYVVYMILIWSAAPTQWKEIFGAALIFSCVCVSRHEGPSLLHFYWDESCLTAFNKMHLHLIFPQNISCTLSWTNEVNLREVLVRERHTFYYTSSFCWFHVDTRDFFFQTNTNVAKLFYAWLFWFSHHLFSRKQQMMLWVLVVVICQH